MLFSSISPSPSETYTLSLHDALPISAMQTELAKVKTTIEVKEENSAISCVLYGKAKWKDKAKFETYEDHRMAMALTPLACLHPILIRQPDVVTKSYPGFWKDISKIGFKIEK